MIGLQKNYYIVKYNKAMKRRVDKIIHFQRALFGGNE